MELAYLYLGTLAVVELYCFVFIFYLGTVVAMEFWDRRWRVMAITRYRIPLGGLIV